MSKPILTFLLVVVGSIGSLSFAQIVSAVPPDPGWGSEPRCWWDQPGIYIECCWGEGSTVYCQECRYSDKPLSEWECKETVAEPAVQLPPTASPTVPENALPQGDVQQPTPPLTGGKGLFGSEGLATPPTGLAPPAEPPAPTSEPTVPPETDQGEEDGTGGGGTKPPVKDLPDTGIAEQPDVQQPEEEPSDQEQDTAGPLT